MCSYPVRESPERARRDHLWLRPVRDWTRRFGIGRTGLRM